MRSEGIRQLFVGWREGDRVRSVDDCIPDDPDQYERTARYANLVNMQRRLCDTLPFMAAGFVHRTYACVYDYSPDGMPILDCANSPRGLYFALGFSGGGFSLSPFIGRALAHLITTGDKIDGMDLLRLDRFFEGESISWSNAARG